MSLILRTFLRTNCHHSENDTMCQAMIEQITESTAKKAPEVLVEEHAPGERPVGRGGRDRERRIMDIVDGAQRGDLTIPR